MTTEHNSVRQHILDTGKTIITGKGFAGVGLNEILTAAGVPKGSFYHYFKSKELFGEALLDDYIGQYLAQMETILSQPGQSAARSLMDYWASWNDLDADSCDCRCLVVKLSGEVADMSEAMRVTLLEGTNRIVARLAVCVEQALADGSLRQVADAKLTALALYQLWLGAALLTKLRREPSALHAAWQTTLTMLGLPANTQGGQV
ncbi:MULTISPECIES: TetR/AcrR family transcriptional regulator [unclassified Duganella]|uniref:TetR/AcrR family transcriptional regulator n=1 Tax=unclassified Duganella TaxID=2636909 RepID=UPI000E34797B|nr:MULTISPECIES: TetR/AcrR family transcriptional regulator [unclassified Duganella]RFP09982.1 TetR/AcrR family transcriptional regulator [Duganella sp. BJB475]RFP25713.1 TetR/AcrR family transcriptional regulator [Duganella sp. BJB476]